MVNAPCWYKDGTCNPSCVRSIPWKPVMLCSQDHNLWGFEFTKSCTDLWHLSFGIIVEIKEIRWDRKAYFFPFKSGEGIRFIPKKKTEKPQSLEQEAVVHVISLKGEPASSKAFGWEAMSDYLQDCLGRYDASCGPWFGKHATLWFDIDWCGKLPEVEVKVKVYILYMCTMCIYIYVYIYVCVWMIYIYIT